MYICIHNNDTLYAGIYIMCVHVCNNTVMIVHKITYSHTTNIIMKLPQHSNVKAKPIKNMPSKIILAVIQL